MIRLLTIALVLCASGCVGSLLETKMAVPDVYVLNAAQGSASATQTIPTDVAIARPAAAPGLDSERIAVLHEARRLDFYREAQWGTALPHVVQWLTVSTLQNEKLFRSVTTEQGRVSADYLLDLDIRDFQAEYTNDSSPPTVRVTIVGSLIRIHDRKLIGVLPSSFTATASENRLGAVVRAFESAAQQATVSLGKQAADAITTSSMH
jgi:cholesterol transport system auxiliary component